MNQEAKQEVVSIILIDNLRRILLVRKGNAWFLPGGKIEQYESKEDCLRRELDEELPNLNFTISEYYGDFTGISPNSHTPTMVTAYLGSYEAGGIDPSSEISASIWAAKKEIETLNVSEITQTIVSTLLQEGRL